MDGMAEIVLLRHGQTEWSLAGKHPSYTDVELTPVGERQARELGDRLADRAFAGVISSPRRRAVRPAELAGLRISDVDEDLAEWNYGRYEGIPSQEIHDRHDPNWALWTDGAPEGELPAQVGARVDRVLSKAAKLLEEGDVALVGHGHCLRV